MPCGACGQRRDNVPPPEMSDRQKGAMDRLCKVADVMDFNAITVCGKGFGWDGILGLLIPEVGDFITAIIAFYTMSNIFVHFNEVFRKNWCTMVMNIFIDLLIGLIPLLGDICDFYWHSYALNANIVRKYYGLEPIETIRTYAQQEADAEAAAQAAGKNKTRSIEAGGDESKEDAKDKKSSEP